MDYPMGYTPRNLNFPTPEMNRQMYEWVTKERNKRMNRDKRMQAKGDEKKKERGKRKTGLKCSTSKKEEMNWKSQLNKDETEVNKGSES